MHEDILRKKIYQLCEKDEALAKSKSVLTRNLKNINEELKNQGVCENSKNIDAELSRLCNLYAVIGTYVFKTAFNDFKGTDPLNFLNNKWNKEIIIGKQEQVFLMMSVLYEACASREYLDSGGSSSAYNFVKGDYVTDDFVLLIQVLRQGGLPYLYKSEAIVEAESGSMKDVMLTFDSIISADDLRSNLSDSINVDVETERILNEIYNNLKISVFKGISNCCIQTSVTDSSMLEGIRVGLEEREFNATFQANSKGTLVLVHPVKLGGDYNIKYSEAQLEQMLNIHLGSMYHFVAVYSEKVILPRILDAAINTVVAALSEVTINDFAVSIKMIETKTDAYSQLFSVLRDKGFEVNVKDTEQKEFEMRW